MVPAGTTLGTPSWGAPSLPSVSHKLRHPFLYPPHRPSGHMGELWSVHPTNTNFRKAAFQPGPAPLQSFPTCGETRVAHLHAQAGTGGPQAQSNETKLTAAAAEEESPAWARRTRETNRGGRSSTNPDTIKATSGASAQPPSRTDRPLPVEKKREEKKQNKAEAKPRRGGGEASARARPDLARTGEVWYSLRCSLRW